MFYQDMDRFNNNWAKKLILLPSYVVLSPTQHLLIFSMKGPQLKLLRKGFLRK